MSESGGSGEVCVDPGIIGRMNASLSVTLQVQDGKAGKHTVAVEKCCVMISLFPM